MVCLCQGHWAALLLVVPHAVVHAPSLKGNTLSKHNSIPTTTASLPNSTLLELAWPRPASVHECSATSAFKSEQLNFRLYHVSPLRAILRVPHHQTSVSLCTLACELLQLRHPPLHVSSSCWHSSRFPSGCCCHPVGGPLSLHRLDIICRFQSHRRCCRHSWHQAPRRRRRQQTDRRRQTDCRHQTLRPRPRSSSRRCRRTTRCHGC
jgi:hypothetical protein